MKLNHIIFVLVLILVYLYILAQPAPWLTFDHLPKPIRPFRPIGVALLNEIFKRITFPRVTKDSILWLSKTKTGLNELYDDNEKNFEKGLDMLSQSIENDTNLNYLGRLIVWAQLDITVSNRLKIGDYYYNKGYAKKTNMRPPIFILGMPRSGSTFLHNLLSLDEDNFRAPRMWEIVDPVPPLGVQTNQTFNRFIRKTFNEFGTGMFRFLSPTLTGVHPIHSDNAEECMPILALDMLSYHFHTIMNVPTYHDWVMTQDQTRALEWHEKFLRVLTVEDRIWLLKAPWHMNHLEAIFKVYPDAKIIVTHREPSKMLASLSSLLARLYGLVSDDINPHGIGAYLTKLWSTIVERFVHARRKLAQTPQGKQIYDIHFSGLTHDPLSTAKQVYQFLGLELTPSTEKKMRTWLETDIGLGKKGASGKHEYQPEWYGLDEDMLNQIPSFVEYMNMFHS